MLIARARTGDSDAFGVLYLRHYDAVARVCHRRLGDVHLAEDATQETFLRAWRALPNFTHDVNLAHWLRRIARNHCADLQRAAARERLITSSASAADEPDPAAQDAVELIPESLAVRRLLARLRPRDAELLVDHHAAGASVRALAQRWHMTKGAMEVALHRARARARRHARDEGLGGVFPVLAARRLSLAAHRITPPVRELGVPAAAAWAQVAIVVVTAGVLPGGPGNAPLEPADSLPSVTRTGADAATLMTSAERRARSPVTAADGSSRAAGRQRPAQRARAERDGRTALVPFEPVGVGDREVRSSPGDDWEVERRYDVHNPVTDRSLVNMETHKGRHPEHKPLHDQACPAVNAGRPLVRCTTPGR